MNLPRWIALYFMTFSLFQTPVIAQEPAPGKTIEIEFPDSGLPPTLYTMMTGTPAVPCLTVRLPDDYDPAKTYPLIVYVPGFHGGPKGNIYNSQTIAGPTGWIAATVPLFKQSVDPNEMMGGLIVGFQDYPAISKAYGIMLGRLFEMIPNVDRDRSAMVGFSNGSQTIAVLVTNQDEFILTHFRNFCLVDHGMFHLTDLHKKNAKGCRYLVLVGDKQDYGRELKIRGAQMLRDEMKILGITLTCGMMKDTGHEFNERHMALVGGWLRNEDLSNRDDVSLMP